MVRGDHLRQGQPHLLHVLQILWAGKDDGKEEDEGTVGTQHQQPEPSFVSFVLDFTNFFAYGCNKFKFKSKKATFKDLHHFPGYVTLHIWHKIQ